MFHPIILYKLGQSSMNENDEILGLVTLGQPNRFGKVSSRRGKRGTRAEVEEKGEKRV